LYQQKERTMKTLVNQIEKAIQLIIDGHATQYITCKNSDDDLIKIRVSNHKSNPTRMGDLDISLVVQVAESEDETEEGGYNFSINKKSFSHIPNQYFLNEDGGFIENFYDVEEMLNYHDIEF
jgi:hypothetical protein